MARWPELPCTELCDSIQMEVVVEGCINLNADHDRVCKHLVSPALTVCALTPG